MPDRPSFSFGENWLKYLDAMPPEALERMHAYVTGWLGSSLAGCRLVDVGSGQGLTSLVAHELGAEVVSFDVDPSSVAATRRLWERAGQPRSWRVEHGSILDPAFTANLGTFDVVASWGVLHHTGRLWDAIDSAAGLAKPGGVLWIALYHRTPQSGRSLRTKGLYNAMPEPGRFVFRTGYDGAKVAKHLLKYRSVSRLRDYSRERGMSWRRDTEDWLGGLPYEVSSPGEVLDHLRPLGFTLERLHDAIGEGVNDVYLFRRSA